ncbi:MAG: T9SS type A sorting domain-containing protein [Sediminibacterium sp.]|nr:T9SS type A sorting domain-containing protein [Sediminibacterium sp.]
MKAKAIITILAVVLLTELSNSQNDQLNHQKYWFYRWRLLKSFMVVGDCDGCSIPANQRRHYAYQNGEIDNLKFGDGTIILGQYISMLATEFKLLTINNQSTLQTRKELYYALKAFNRLDLKAEECKGMACLTGNNRLNGYYIREDVPVDFLIQHPELAPANQTSPLSVGHVYADNCVEESQDQGISMLMGMKLCSMYIPSNTFYKGDNDDQAPFVFQDGETDILKEAKNITTRIVGFMKNGDWIHYRPCSFNEQVNGGHGGGDSRGLAYALNNIAYSITGDPLFLPYIKLSTTYCLWTGAVNLAIVSVGCEGPWIMGVNNWNRDALTYQLIAMGGEVSPTIPPTFCGVASPLSTDRNIIINESVDLRAGKCKFEWMPLLHCLVENYDLNGNIWPNSLATYINDAPCNGPYSFKEASSNCSGWNQEVCDAYPYPNKNIAPYNWSSSNLLYSPNRRWYNAELGSDPDLSNNIFEGEYNGLDYMLLYNLYRINQIKQEEYYFPGYYDMRDNLYEQDLPYVINLPFGSPVIYGNHAAPYKREAFESIKSSSKINADGDVTFRAGKEIALKPGFEVHSTADFHGYIQPLICNTNDNYYHRSVSAEVVSGKMDLSGVKVDLFPNPANTNFTVRSTEIMQEVIIYDLNGKQVLHKKDIESSIVEIDTTLLVKGLYVVEVVNKPSSNRFRVKLSLN